MADTAHEPNAVAGTEVNISTSTPQVHTHYNSQFIAAGLPRLAAAAPQGTNPQFDAQADPWF